MNNLYIQAFTLRQKYQNDADALGLFLSSIHLTQPGLAREVFSGLDNHVKVRVLDRFYGKHLTDNIISPRTLKGTSMNGTFYMTGEAKIQIEE